MRSRVPGEFVGDYDYARSANPTRAALEQALGELEGGLAVAFSYGLAAEHALITVVCGAGRTWCCRQTCTAGTYRLVDKVLARWGLAYDLVEQTDLDALAAGRPRRYPADLGREPDQPAAERDRHRGRGRAARRCARRRRQHVRDAGEPAPARARGRLRRALDDEVPGRALGRRGRRRRHPRARVVRAPALRAERRRRGPGPVRLLPRAPRPANAPPADGRARAQRRGRRRAAAGRRRRCPTSAGRGSAAWSASAIPRRRRSPRARGCSRWPNRSAASSR